MENLLIFVNIIAVILVVVIYYKDQKVVGLGVSQDNFTTTRSVGTFLTKFTSIVAALFIILYSYSSYLSR